MSVRRLNHGIVLLEDLHSDRIAPAAEFLAEHAGHVVTAGSTIVDRGCRIVLRICADCQLIHVAHNDPTGGPA